MKKALLCLMALACAIACTACAAYEEYSGLIEKAMETGTPRVEPLFTPEPVVLPEPEDTQLPEEEMLWRPGAPVDAEVTAQADAPQYCLVVDRENQVVLAYTMEESAQPERVMACSTGKEGHITPTGGFVLEGPVASWGFFPEYGCYARYMTQLEGSLFFHSTPYSAPEEAALGLPAWREMGTRASYGNIRLLPDDARWIYENCPKGTECEIIEGEKDEALRKKALIPEPPA